MPQRWAKISWRVGAVASGLGGVGLLGVPWFLWGNQERRALDCPITKPFLTTGRPHGVRPTPTRRRGHGRAVG